MDLMNRARRLVAEHGIGLIVVDYLQLMDSAKRTQNRDRETAAISRSLKMMAKEFDIPVLALSQLNRKLEDRADRTPKLGDLRDSGALEQDADVVIFIYREDVYDAGSRPGEADIIVAKHRNGAIGTVTMTFNKELTRFE
jgi:replicative DNA helicase